MSQPPHAATDGSPDAEPLRWPASDPALLPPEPDWTLVDPTTLACRHCSYSLVGLKPNGVCPECGSPIPQDPLRVSFVFLTQREAQRLQYAVWELILCFYAAPCAFVFVMITDARMHSLAASSGVVLTLLMSGCSHLAVLPTIGKGRGSSCSLLLLRVLLVAMLFACMFTGLHGLDIIGRFYEAVWSRIAAVILLPLILITATWRLITLALRNPDARAEIKPHPLYIAGVAAGVLGLISWLISWRYWERFDSVAPIVCVLVTAAVAAAVWGIIVLTGILHRLRRQITVRLAHAGVHPQDDRVDD